MKETEKILCSVWLKNLLDVDFLGKDVIIKQINSAKVSFIAGHEYISIKFHIDTDVPLFLYKTRTPVSMLAWQPNGTPIEFILHVIDGVIDELEVVRMDLLAIDYLDIDLSKLEHMVCDTVCIL